MNERIEENGKVIANNFNSLGLQVVFKKGFESATGDTYFFDLQYISQYNKRHLKSLLETIAIYHHLDMELLSTKESHFAVFVKQYNHTLSLTQCLCETGQREVVIGQDASGSYTFLDFDTIHHLLIAGATGSGKSVLLHNIIVNLYSKYRGKGFELVVIDPKGTELNEWGKCFNVSYVDNTEKAIFAIDAVVAEMEKRYKNNLMNKHEIFVVVDELAELMLTSKFKVEKSLVRLSQLGRACGIHLILATQNPKVEVCTGLIKSNFPYRVCLKTASIRDSVVVLDRKGAEELEVGEGYFNKGTEMTRFKVAYPEKELIAKVIQQNNRG